MFAFLLCLKLLCFSTILFVSLLLIDKKINEKSLNEQVTLNEKTSNQHDLLERRLQEFDIQSDENYSSQQFCMVSNKNKLFDNVYKESIAHQCFDHTLHKSGKALLICIDQNIEILLLSSKRDFLVKYCPFCFTLN